MARLKRLITKSPDRIESPSPLEQAHCCPLFILDYQKQLRHKQGILEQAL